MNNLDLIKELEKCSTTDLVDILRGLTQRSNNVIIPVAIFKIDIKEFAGRSITDEEFQKFKKYLHRNHDYDIAKKSFYLLRDEIRPAFVEENPEFKNEEVAKKLGMGNTAILS